MATHAARFHSPGPVRGKLSGAVHWVLVLQALAVFSLQQSFASEVPNLSDPITTTQSLWRSGDRPAAHTAVAAALPQALAAADTQLAGRLLILQGQMHTAVGDGAIGEAPLQQGLAYTRATRDNDWELKALRWLGVAQGQNLDNAGALRTFTTMRDLAIARGAATHQAWAEVGVAHQNGLAGDLTAARAGYESAVALFRTTGETHGEIFALNGLGNILNALQDYTAARRCYERTLAAGLKINAPFTAALAANNLGTLEYNLGDPGRALTYFRQSYKIQMADGNLREAINAARNISICLTWLGDLDKSLDLLDEAIATCRERSYRELEYAALTHKGLVLNLQGRPRQAEAIFADLDAWTDDIFVGNRLEMVASRAEALDGLGDLDGSVALMREHWPAIQKFEYQVARLDFAARLGERLARQGHPAEALTFLLPANAAAAQVPVNGPRLVALPAAAKAYLALDQPDSALACLRRAAAVWEHERQVPLDPEWRERRGLAGRAIFTELAALIMQAPPPGAEPAHHLPEAYAVLQRFKARTLSERMFGPGQTPTLGEGVASLAELRRVLRAGNEMLLDAFVGPQHSYLFVVTADTLLVRPLPPEKDLAARVAVLRRAVTAARQDDAALALGTQALAELLLPPDDLQTTTDRRLIFCPDGPLHQVPLSLVRPGGVTQRVPSASILVRLRASAGPAADQVHSLLAATGGEADALPGAEREVVRLARRFAAVATALADSVPGPTSLQGFDLVHLAAHAEVSDLYPWRSSVRIRGAGGAALPFDAAGIARSRINARLAVLAACTSGGGRIVGGEGVMGLGSAFLAAGAPIVVASLWDADDQATALLMDTFYEGLASGATVAEALAMARAVVAALEQYAAPRYWAGFVAIGDGGRILQLPTRRRLPGGLPAFAGGCVLLLAAIFVARAGRAKKSVTTRPGDSSHP